MGRVEGEHAPDSNFSGACAVGANLKGGSWPAHVAASAHALYGGGLVGLLTAWKQLIFRTVLHNFGVWVFLRFLIQIFCRVVFLCINE